jgi:[protein-PII] uridylyltransferase
LHYLTDRPHDVLAFQHQRPIAMSLEYADTERSAEDEFMRDLFNATRAVEHVVSAVVTELSAGSKRTRTDGPFAVVGGRVVLLDEPDLRREPERALELFSQGAPPGATVLRWLEETLDGLDELPWTDAVRMAFFRLLRTGHPAVLEAADHAGVFGRLLPEWDAVRCQPQRNVYHAFTVDAHLFNTVVALNELERDDDPLVRDVVADVADRDLLVLAALLHDVGKGTDEDHSERGERIAATVAERIGIRDPRSGALAWLVRNHLLLVDAATRRDLSDENLVVDIAERIGDQQRLRMLFLLSVADGRATGPSAWTPWKASLVAELFVKVLHVMERGELVTRDATEVARLRTNELREGLARYPTKVVEEHLSSIPRAYMLAFPTTVLIRHFALMADELAETDARTHVARTEEPGTYELTVVARDRPGLFAKASGVLALNGISIADAQGFTRSDGVAIEVFRCHGAFESSIDDARWDRVRADMERALRGRLALDMRIAEKRQAYASKVSKGKGEAPKIIIDNGVSDFLTVVEVHAPDRVGLLYDITSAFAELALDIRLAKIATYGEDVVDVFYVRDLEGQKIADAEHLAEIERSLLHRLER